MTIEEQLCARTYNDNTTLSSQVVTAVTAATSSASSYTKGKDPTEPLNYPPCAVSCSGDIMSFYGLIESSNLASMHTTSLAAVAIATNHVSASLRPMLQLWGPAIGHFAARQMCRVSHVLFPYMRHR